MDDFLDDDLGGPPEARRARRSRAGLPAGTSAAAMRVRGPPHRCCGRSSRPGSLLLVSAPGRVRATGGRGAGEPAGSCLCRARALACRPTPAPPPCAHAGRGPAGVACCGPPVLRAAERPAWPGRGADRLE
jgi:hypothetical protein